MFHLDFHGKFPRQEWKGMIDLGRVPALVYHKDLSDNNFIDSLTNQFCKDIDSIYKGVVLGTRQLKPKTDPDCALHGYWGDWLHTMTSQANKLGIPSFQFEMEPEIRKSLAEDNNIQKQWAKIIVKAYQEMIVPFWKNKVKPVTLNPSLVDLVKEQPFTGVQLNKLKKEWAKSDEETYKDLV